MLANFIGIDPKEFILDEYEKYRVLMNRIDKNLDESLLDLISNNIIK